MKIPLVDLKANYLSIKNEIDEAISRVINNSSFIMGKDVEDFDKNFANFIGSKYSIGVGNGTQALYLALFALDINKGEVITVPNTFIATTEMISSCGAKPVFVDIDEESYNIDVNKIEEKITDNTKAIIPVHLYGNPSNLEEILKLANEHDLKVIEDCAQANGTKYNDINVGNYGDVATFSFFPAKVLGAFGDAGAITTNDKDLAERISLLRNHGRITKYEHLVEGFNYRIDTIQAAILNVKLKHLDEWINKRRDIAHLYNRFFSEYDLNEFVITPKENKNGKHCYYMYVVRTKDRDKLQSYLKENEIETGIHYPLPLHLQPAYKHLGHKKGDFPVTEKVANEILSLPLYPEMSLENVDYVVGKIKNFYKN